MSPDTEQDGWPPLDSCIDGGRGSVGSGEEVLMGISDMISCHERGVQFIEKGILDKRFHAVNEEIEALFRCVNCTARPIAVQLTSEGLPHS
ncbi:hypothetical protein CDAR_550111 [Caerostris darwini]|uniref:Uncharacterized protein n=1 Tax=Caerostris darwini TaxID=1538125 RepID=A0AAV4PKH6_9ARAC|nr:hypothetical protein CDAR_550111 [Caerostris darwini]